MYKYLQVNGTVLSVRFLAKSKLPYRFIALKLLSNSTKFTAIHILHTSKNNIFIDAIQFHCNVGQSTQYMYIYETMKVQIVFCCVAISSAAEMEKRPEMVANLLFPSCSQYLSNVWRPLLGALECYCFALMKKLKISAKCIPSQIELSNQNISSGRGDLLDF